MSLRDLIQDRRTSISDEVSSLIDARRYAALHKQLSAYEFWEENNKHKCLWEHQKRAIETALAYLVADPHVVERQEFREAALLKMPTGTGKSGIVAVLSRCVTSIKRTLVLTPRRSLVSQMMDDVRFRFWSHLGYQTVEGSSFTANADDMGSALLPAYIERLLPKNCSRILKHAEPSEKTVLIGTYQALDMIRRQSKDSRAELKSDRETAIALLELLRSFDLVIVDEGHYEPAISWSKGVRDLNKPTILLSATPYRNDYKSFRVKGRFVFNYPHQDATSANVIRDIGIQPLQPRGQGSAPERFVSALAKALPEFKRQASAWTTTPKIMIRADDLETLEILQRLVNSKFKTHSVLIHDRARATRAYPRRYVKVRQAFRECADAEFWLHQFKLMEGVDDPDFIAVAIYDLPMNARQLVQQIGRIVRTSPGRRRKQLARVYVSSAHEKDVSTSWNRYLEFEKYCSEQTNNIVVNEIALPNRLLTIMPTYQYIEGEFRQKFDAATSHSVEELQVNTSAAVLQWSSSKRTISALAEIIEDAISDKDRFHIVPISDLPVNSIGFTYYAWRNSPLLIDKFFSEWRLGVFVAVEHGDLAFIHDSEGMVIDAAGLGLKTASRIVLENAFPVTSQRRPSRLTRMSFSSLDLSERAIRTMALRTRSFETTFTDLLDPHLVPTAAAGFVGGRARYVGFAKGRLRDSHERRVPIREYIEWTKSAAREFNADLARNSVFERYALVRDDISAEGAMPKTILMNLSRDELVDETPQDSEARILVDDPTIDHDDLCADVDEHGCFQITVLGKTIDCEILYNSETKRYRFKSEQLDELFEQREPMARSRSLTASQRISADQSFRINVAESKVVYTEKRFFQPRIALKLPDGSIPILADVYTAPVLANTRSEKGEQFFRTRARWRTESLFGVIEDICIEPHTLARRRSWATLGDRLSKYPLIICDDDSKEIADFIAVDPVAKRVLFLHAKAKSEGDGRYHVDTLQEVGRQATASLAFLNRTPPAQGWAPNRWTGNVQANRIVLRGRNRIFKNSLGLTPAQITDALRTACGHPAYSREVWIVGGNMLDRSFVETAIADDDIDNRLMQFLLHWESLRTATARAGAKLTLFCH